jgi:hypothetical protein
MTLVAIFWLACLGGFLTLCERSPVMDNEQ